MVRTHFINEWLMRDRSGGMLSHILMIHVNIYIEEGPSHNKVPFIIFFFFLNLISQVQEVTHLIKDSSYIYSQRAVHNKFLEILFSTV